MVSSRFLLALERDLPCSWESGYELASADINFVVHLGFPDQTLTIEDLIADEDRVAARLTAVGTHLGEFRGIPATGRRITTETFDIVRAPTRRSQNGGPSSTEAGCS